MDIFEVQFREGQQARINEQILDANPYDPETEMGKAWESGWKSFDGYEMEWE